MAVISLMANKKKGQVHTIDERATHLRKFLKRAFWKAHRQKTKGFIKKSSKH
jgi:hypothetical protein